MALLHDIVISSWQVLLDSAPWMLLGFFAAGLLKAYLPDSLVARHLGTSGVGSVVRASLFGIPLPLCSCGVLPAAMGLRRQGANKGATAAFLISTPETGVDSMAVTWALLDPLMTLLRPVAAFITATVAGLLINRADAQEPVPSPAPPEAGCGCSGSHCSSSAPASPAHRLRDGLGFAFGEMLDDIGRWFLLGIVLAGLIGALLPDDLFTVTVRGELLSLVLMLVAGIPMYICATASTPIAAALVFKGLSPGAALVFLLSGPATNAATLAVLGRFFGRRAVGIYLGTIAGFSLLLGWLVNRIYAFVDFDSRAWHGAAAGAHGPLAVAAALLLLGLIGRAWWGRRGKRGVC